jgi:hypothetical protein
MANKKINFDFRILNLKPEIFDQFCKLAIIEKIYYRVGRFWNNPKRFVVLWPISEKTPSRRVMVFIKKYKIQSSDYGIFISLNASKQSEEVKIPRNILDFYKRFGGQIDFSYIFIEER